MVHKLAIGFTTRLMAEVSVAVRPTSATAAAKVEVTFGIATTEFKGFPSPRDTMFIESWTGYRWDKRMWIASQGFAGALIASSAVLVVLKSVGYETGLTAMLLQVVFLMAIFPRYTKDAFRVWMKEFGAIFDSLLAIGIFVSCAYLYDFDTFCLWACGPLQFLGISLSDAIIPSLKRFDDWQSHVVIVFIAPLVYVFLRIAWEIELMGDVVNDPIIFTFSGKSLTLFGVTTTFFDIVVVRMFQGSWGILSQPYGYLHARSKSYLIDVEAPAADEESGGRGTN